MPTIRKHPSNTYAALGKSVTLTCDYESGTTGATVVWFQDGSPVITQFDNPASYKSVSGGDLLFLKLSQADVGWYFCNITNQYGSAVSNNATLEIAGRHTSLLYYSDYLLCDTALTEGTCPSNFTSQCYTILIDYFWL